MCNTVLGPTLSYVRKAGMYSEGFIRRLEIAGMRIMRGISGKHRWVSWQNRISNFDIGADMSTSCVSQLK